MSCYPSAEDMIARGESSALYIHRSFRSSIGLMLLTAVSVVFVVHTIIDKGNDYRFLAAIPVTLVLELARRYLNDLYIITRDQVVHQKGRISLRYAVPSIRCIDLRAISVEQSLWGRIINYGEVGLATAAQSGAEITMYGLVSPAELAKLIDDLRVYSQRAALDDSNSNEPSRVSND